LEDIRIRALDLRLQGLSVEEIRDKIFGRESSLAGLTGGDFSIKNLITSCLNS